MPTEATQKTTTSGIATNESGERHIPASRRADGSMRKEIRVRPGYRPPEDIEIYRNKTAEAWKNRGKGGVPGAESMIQPENTNNPTTNKNAKRREARKRAAAVATGVDGKNGETVAEGSTDTVASPATEVRQSDATVAENLQTVDPDAEKEKEAKKLTKKLRQARELKEKKEKGDTLLPEQIEKVIRITELIRQLDNLGFNEHGEKKETDP